MSLKLVISKNCCNFINCIPLRKRALCQVYQAKVFHFVIMEKSVKNLEIEK